MRLLESVSWFKKSLASCRHIGKVLNFIISPDSYKAIHMMFIYKITEVKFSISLCIYHDLTLAANDAVAYTCTPYL